MRRSKNRSRQQIAFDFTLPRLRYKLHSYWQAATVRQGCVRPEEAIVKTYRQTGSIAKTAAILGFSETTIRNKLHKLGEPVKRRGGNNNPYGRKGRPETRRFRWS